MAKTKISEFNANPALNTDIDSINLAEGCAPSGINDAIRELMAQLKDWQAGTSNDPMVIGSSGSLTLNQGTANGVAYLNGSKVVTSGSALTFDSSDRLIVGAASAVIGQRIEVVGNTSGGAIGIRGRASDAIGVLSWHPNAASTEYARIQSDNTSSLQFGVGASGTEQMRLTSTGLGIGTSSPSAKLEAAGNIKVSYAASAANSSLIVNNTSSSASSTSQIIATNDASRSLRIQYTSSGGAGGAALSGGFTGEVAQIFTDNNYPISIGTNGTARLNLDTSGNLGLGVTPSAWNTVTPVLQINKSALYGYGNEVSLSANYLYSSGDKYIASDYATRYNQGNGSHKWYTAPSGTAGNAITFTQAMTLDASGNLALGTTSALQRMHISSASSVTRLLVENTNNAAAGSGIQMLVTSGGSTVGNGTIRIDNADNMQFFNIGGERARISSSGNYMVATTSVGGTISCARNGNTYNYYATSDANNTTEGFFLGYSSGASANRIIIYSNGNVVNANNSYGALSDSKLKENIVDATPKLAGLMQVKVRNYNLIGETTKQLGVVAQELETVFPAMVDESPDKDAEGNDLGTTTKSVKYSVFVPMLIKAIQELKAEFDAYKASHP